MKHKKGRVRSLNWNDLTEEQKTYSLKMIKLYLRYIGLNKNETISK